MLLAHNFPGKTNDVDAVPSNGVEFNLIKDLAEEIAKELGIAHDWLNPYFGAFTVYLPPDAKNRMKVIYSGQNLCVDALGAEDVLIMKLMAGRAKDRAHIRHLINKNKADIKVVERALEALKDKNMFRDLAEKALDLLDEELED